MQGAAVDDDLLAAAWAASKARPKAERLSRARVARALGVSRQTVSGYLNANAAATRSAYERAVAAGRLPAVLARFGLEGADALDDDDEDGLAPEFRIGPAVEITPTIVEQAAALIHTQGLPPLHALLVVGADEADAREWLEGARTAADERDDGWPADGWRLLRRVQAAVAGELLSQARGGRAADCFRIGAIVDPGLFGDVADAAEQADPFAEYSDEELARLVAGDFDGGDA